MRKFIFGAAFFLLSSCSDPSPEFHGTYDTETKKNFIPGPGFHKGDPGPNLPCDLPPFSPLKSIDDKTLYSEHEVPD
jgi:hypothetical protein